MTDTTDTTTTPPPVRHVQASFHFVVGADVTDEQVGQMIGAMFAQVDGDAAVDYDSSGNHITVPVEDTTVRYAVGSGL